MHKIYLTTVTLLLVVIAAGFYKFILQGSTIQSIDERTTILLTETERNLVLNEMRSFLISVQQISLGIADNNMGLVIEAARKSGKSAQADVPGTLIGKLPLPFKQLGFDTHKKFDQLAMDSEDLGDREHALRQLSELMQNCVSCHAAFRIDS
jgi:hypothetical protein